MRYLLLLTGFFFINISIFAQGTPRGGNVTSTIAENGKTFVIIVGVSDYSYLKEEQQLNYADDDAQLMQDYLATWENIEFKTFLNENATPRDRIGMEIEKTLMNDAKSGDKVIIFFAGHGDLDEMYGEGYLLLNQVKPPSEAIYKWNDALPLKDVKASIDIANKNGVEVYLIADACHSGSVLNVSSNAMFSGMNENSISMISCKKGQVSFENQTLEHGVFTYHLTQGLQGLADQDGDMKITMYELQRYVQDKVRIETNGSQQPVFESSDENIVLSNVDAEVLKELQKGTKNNSAGSVAQARSLSGTDQNLSKECQALLQLFNEQLKASKFLNEDLDTTDKQKIWIGTVHSKKNHDKQVAVVTSSTDGNTIASSGEDGIAIYKKEDLKKPIWLKGHTGKVSGIDFNHSGTMLASAGTDRTVILWNPMTGEKINSLIKLSGEASTVKFVSDEVLAIGTLKGAIEFWTIDQPKTVVAKLHKGKVNAIEVNYPLVFSSGDDGTIVIYNLETRKKQLVIKAHEGAVRGLKFLNSTNSLLSIGMDGQLKEWNISNGKVGSQVDFGFGDLNDLEVDPYETYCFVGSKQKKLSIVDLSNFQLVKSRTGSTSGINSLHYDPSTYSMIAGEYDGSVTIQKIKIIPENASAYDLREKLNDCSGIEENDVDLDLPLLAELNSKINKVLNPIINGSPVVPDQEEIEKAKRYAEKALEIGKEHGYHVQELEGNLLLLEVHEILSKENKDQYDEAALKMKKLEELDPKGAYIYTTDALLQVKLNNWEKAKSDAVKAEQLAPVWSEASYTAGKVLWMSGDLKNAEVKFKETIKKSPHLSKGYSSLGELYYQQGKYEEAKVNFEKALKIDSTVSSRMMYNATLQKLETPTTVKKTNSKSKYNLGDDFSGGIIIYIDETGEHGLVCPPYYLGKANWDGAKKICDQLVVGNFSNWRLPTLEELNKCSVAGYNFNGFNQAPFWTSTEQDAENAFWLRPIDGSSDKALKTNERFVLAVKPF